MGALLRTFWQAVVGSLFGGGGSGGITRDDLVTFVTDVSTVITAMAENMEQEHGAVAWVNQNAGDLGDQLVTLSNGVQQAVSWVAFTMLPNSLGNMQHNIYVGWIQPMGASITQLQRQVQDIYARLGQVWTEVYNQLRPDVNSLLAFESAFKEGDQPSINQLIAWLRDPVSMGDFVAPVVAQPLAAYLNSSPVEPLRKGYAYLLTNVWADESGAIWDAVARWLVADT